MIEPEVLKELRIIVAKVAHADQASGRAPAHVLQAKEKVREELVSAVREKYEAYLATANQGCVARLEPECRVYSAPP